MLYNSNFLGYLPVMAYNVLLANRIRESMQHLKQVEEKEMMGGLAFMLNHKMCVGIIKDELMCRIDPVQYEQVLERPGCREMDFTGRPMRGWVMIGEEGYRRTTDFDFWINRALDYNKKVKVSVKKRKS